MTTFDDRLSARFRSLDAAIPSPLPPDRVIGQAILRERRSDEGRASSRARRLATIIALLIATGVVAGNGSSMRKPEPRLEAALHSSGHAGLPFAGRCGYRIRWIARLPRLPRLEGQAHRACSTTVRLDRGLFLAAAMVETLRAELLTLP
jgi:hypothetical protein